MNTSNTLDRPAPVCGILSVVLTPLALVFAFLASSLVEALVGRAPHGVARAIALVSLSCILAGVAIGIAGVVRQERLRWLPVLGWFSTICIVALSIYLDKDG